MRDRTIHAIHTENPGHETDHQELGSGQCHHYVHKPNPVYQIDPISSEHNPSELSARIPDYRRYSPMGAPVAGVLKARKGELDSNWCCCWIVNDRCLETKVETEGSGSDDSW